MPKVSYLLSQLRNLFIAVLLLGVVGCQSGRINLVQVANDGKVLLFKDKTYDTIYMADSESVRCIVDKGSFFLDPQGRWVLIIDRPQEDSHYHAGDHLTLMQLDNRELYKTRLPFDIFNLENVAIEGGNHTDQASDQSSPQRTVGDGRARIFFCDQLEIVIGPIGIKDQYWRWCPDNKEADQWSCLDRAESEKHLSSDSVLCFMPLSEMAYPPPDCVVEVPSDGLTALRSIWVRPDGSTLELARKNDAPLRFLGACGATVVSPLGMFENYNTGSIKGQLANSIGMPIYYVGLAWHNALEDLEVDGDAVKEAHKKLQCGIEQQQ